MSDDSSSRSAATRVILSSDVGYPFEGHGAAAAVSAHHVVTLREQ